MITLSSGSSCEVLRALWYARVATGIDRDCRKWANLISTHESSEVNRYRAIINLALFAMVFDLTLEY